MFCGDCGGSYPLQDLTRYGNDFICPNCKPGYLQRHGQSQFPPTNSKVAVPVREVKFAGFWIRFIAVIIDALIISVCTLPLLGLTGLHVSDMDNRNLSPAASAQVFLVVMVAFALTVAYEIWFVTNKGGTPGKLALNLRIITDGGVNLTYTHAMGRYFARILSGIPLNLGYVIAAFDSQKRALHDFICNTRVIYRS